MTKDKIAHDTQKINFRVGNFSIVPPNQVNELSKAGYQFLMIKSGKDSDCPHLTQRERECLKIFVEQDITPKQIAMSMNVNDRHVRVMLADIRKKFNVNTDNGLIRKIFQFGMDSYL
jgi:DNA-binding CsgD family transcriptional regulator